LFGIGIQWTFKWNFFFSLGYSSARTLFLMLDETNVLRLLFINLFITLCRSLLKDKQWMNHVWWDNKSYLENL
jgi:hypothetical protein